MCQIDLHMDLYIPIWIKSPTKSSKQKPTSWIYAPAQASPILTTHCRIPNETRGTIVIGEVIYRPNGVETPLQRSLQRDTRCIHHIPV